MAMNAKNKLILSWLAVANFAGSQGARSEPFATAFTYQAQLNEGSGPLNGSADLRFALFGVESGGLPVSAVITLSNQTVADGVVAQRLDFGVDVFDGDSRWLEVALRTPHDPTDTAPFTTLSPRQAISPIPYALQTRGIFVDEAGQVSIGASPVLARGLKREPLPPPTKLSVASDSAGGIGLLGESTATSGDSIGIKGTTLSFAGRGIEGRGPGEGIRGEATSITGDVVGIKGISASLSGRGIEGRGPGEGVRGAATSSNGDVVGVKGTTASMDGKGMEGSGPSKGILGHATATTGVTTGVHGKSDSPDGEGIRGEATATSGPARGVCGISSSTTGEGVMGHAAAQTGTSSGVMGKSESPTGRGIYGVGPNEGVCGEASANNAVPGIGIRGMTESLTGAGVMGCSAGSGNCLMPPPISGNGAGVFGYASPTSPASSSASGVEGLSESAEGAGVLGIGRRVGVSGKATGPANGSATGVYGAVGDSAKGTASPNYGVHGYAQSINPESAGILAEGDGVDPGPPGPRAAALEIRNGAIRVSGDVRTAGTVLVASGGWAAIPSCSALSGPQAHSHTIGFHQDVPIQNDLIVSTSIILATVELDDPEGPNVSYSVHIREKHPGNAILRVTMIGSQGGACPAPSASITRTVHYLIINPCETGAPGCDTNARSARQ